MSLPLGDTLTALWRGLWGRPLPEGVPKAILFSVRLPRVLCVALTWASLGAVIALAFGVTVPGLPYAGTMGMAMVFAFGSLMMILPLAYALAQTVPYAGRFLLVGKDIRALRPAALAREIGVLSQRNRMEYAYTVEEIVGLGRYAHEKGFLSHWDSERKETVEKALALTGLTHLRRASALTLSGGELQRAFLAQVFAQDPRALVLDEPANHLDLK